MESEEEKKEKAEKFLSELKGIAEKYEAKNISVCCELEGKFFGMIGADTENFGDFFNAVMLVARLYQASREKIKSILDGNTKSETNS